MKTRKRNKQGISLIVLVITIIVMIILAAAIILSLSSNGIIDRANEAVDRTNLNQVQTLASTIWADAYSSGKRTEEELQAAVEKGLEGIDTSKYNVVVTKNGVTVTKKVLIEEGNIYNVKEYGAIGNGITDDKAAIIATFEAAIKDLPATVYFPEGEYGLLNGGIYIKVPLGEGGLTVKGDGKEKSTIKFLEGWETTGSWVALRIQPVSTPTTTEEYLHDITITDLGVYDTDPVGHAWNLEEDGDKEETHGFDINYCINATIQNCKVSNVGDEAIDMWYCINSQITNNYVVNSPGAGSDGGAISVGDGCDNVIVTKNSVDGTIDNDEKTNYGIAIEALIYPVKNVTIEYNTISNIRGNGINIAAPNGTIDTVWVKNNNITGCRKGINFDGAGSKTDITLTYNNIAHVNYGVYMGGTNEYNILINEFVIDTVSDCGIWLGGTDTIVSNGKIYNCGKQAIFTSAENGKIKNVEIDGVGIEGGVTSGAIQQFISDKASIEVSNVTIKNCQNSKGIQDVQIVKDTTVEQTEISGYTSISGATTIQNCKVNRLVTIKSGGVIDGLELYTETDLGTHAITLYNTTNCTIKNCKITIPSRHAIFETGTSDYNTITNNTITGGNGIQIIGENSTQSGNTLNDNLIQ